MAKDKIDEVGSEIDNKVEATSEATGIPKWAVCLGLPWRLLVFSMLSG